MSHDVFSPPREIRLDLAPGPKEELSAQLSNTSETFGSASRGGKKERMDPAKMQPAGIQSAKGRAFNQKYSAHYYSELGQMQ